MARFKPIHKGLKLLPVDFDRQVLPGSVEYALCYLDDHELDLSGLNQKTTEAYGDCRIVWKGTSLRARYSAELGVGSVKSQYRRGFQAKG